MINRKVSLITTIVLVLLMGAFIVGSIDLRPRVRLFPLMIAIPTFALLLYVLISEFKKFRNAGDNKNEESMPSDGEEFPVATKVLKMILLLTIFVISVFLFGFIGGILLFMFIFFRFYGNIKWWHEGMMIMGVTGAIFLLSQILLSDLYSGIVFGAKLPAF